MNNLVLLMILFFCVVVFTKGVNNTAQNQIPKQQQNKRYDEDEDDEESDHYNPRYYLEGKTEYLPQQNMWKYKRPPPYCKLRHVQYVKNFQKNFPFF